VLPRWRFALHHLPGSLQVWRPQITQPDGAQLIGPEGFATWARRMGLSAGTHVVVWDECYDAPRLWWAFQHYGLRRVQVLDGGLGAWRDARLPLERGNPRQPTLLGDFTASIGHGFPMADRALVLRSRLAGTGVQLWDTRDIEEWTGRRRLKGARRAGRIPWARHLNWREFREGPPTNLRFRSREEPQHLVEAYGLDPTQRQVFYCQSGVRTTTAILALVRIGWDATQLFNDDRSWRQWSREQWISE
jgi:thiosulfate/3-mercaptopyruvate sulfurtransferase